MVRIIADSTCDLSQELKSRYGITILPLHILLGGQEFEDGEEITPEEIYRWAEANKTTPKTSAPSVERAEACFRPFLEAGDELVCFSISESMSSSASVMRLAAESLDAANRVHVVDSANLSTGIGLLVIEAACMARDGKSAEEIAQEMERLKPLVRASFVVDTLVYLYRGGRCSGLSALAGSALQLHPRIAVVDGAMHPGKKYRGSIEKVTLRYAMDMEEELKKAVKTRVFITHSGSRPEVVEQVRQYLESLHIFDEILETRAGCVVSSHCGPGTLGVLFIAGQ